MTNASQQLLSGAISGFLSSAVLQPLDLLKTRLQQGPVSTSTSDSYFRRLSTAYAQVIKSDGLLGLWRGTTPTLLRNVPGVALYFASQTQLRGIMASSPYFSVRQAESVRRNQVSTLHQLSRGGNLLCGATSRVFVGLILNPVTVIKARYESNLYNYPTFASAFRSIYSEGRHGLFKGFVASSLRDAPYAGIFLVFYEGVKHNLSNANSNSHSSAWLNSSVHATSAATAAVVATVATHPFDVLKTKIQVRQEQHFKSIHQAVIHVIKTDGALEFFNGLSLRLTRKIFSSVIAWAVYESLLAL